MKLLDLVAHAPRANASPLADTWLRDRLRRDSRSCGRRDRSLVAVIADDPRIDCLGFSLAQLLMAFGHSQERFSGERAVGARAVDDSFVVVDGAPEVADDGGLVMGAGEEPGGLRILLRRNVRKAGGHENCGECDRSKSCHSRVLLPQRLTNVSQHTVPLSVSVLSPFHASNR